MSKYTSGPWTVEVEPLDRDNERGGTFVVKDRVCIAVCDASSTLSEFEIVANARLIAASPIMVEMLETISDKSVRDLMTEADWDLVRQVVARATGGDE